MTTRVRRPQRFDWDLGLGRQVGLAFWGMFFLEAAFGSYMGIWPLWIERLGAPVAIVGLVLGSSGILRLFVLLPSASLAERFGTRRLVVASRVAALVGLGGAALATHWTHLAIMVVGSALGELAFPLVQAHVTGHAGEARVRSFTLVFVVGPSIALIATPLLAGALIQAASLRAAFLLAALCTAASIACFWRLSSPASNSTAAGAAPATYRHALADRAVRRLLLLQGLTIFSLAFGTSLVPTFLEGVRGLAPATIATLGALAAVGSTIFGLAVSRIQGLQRAPFVGAAIAVASTAFGFALFLTSDALLLIGLAFVCRGGLFSAWALFAASVGDTASIANRARSFALCEIVGGMCFSLAPMVAGPIYALNAYGPLVLATTLAIILVPILLLVQRSATRDGPRHAGVPAAGSTESLPPRVDATAAP